MSTVVVTGAAGRIGQMVCPGLRELGWTVRPTDVAEVPDGTPIDLTDPSAAEALTTLCDGAAAIVHLGAIPGETDWAPILATNVDGTHRVLDAAHHAGVRRAVLASSNHATGFTRRGEGLLPADTPIRPDTYYGVSKAALEALGALYHERNGMDVVALRIGTCRPAPASVRHLATWLSPGDAVRLVHAALSAPAPGFTQVWGISANTRAWWSQDAGRALGYAPVDDSEHYAAELIGASEPDWYGDDILALVGGEFCQREP